MTRHVFKNADIRSRAAAIRRLESGEEFVHRTRSDSRISDPVRIFYLRENIFLGKSPYRCGEDALEGLWPFYGDWEIESKATWCDTVSNTNKVLCWCSDSRMNTPILALVYRYEPEGRAYPYQAEDTTWWKYAEPAKRSEIGEFYV